VTHPKDDGRLNNNSITPESDMLIRHLLSAVKRQRELAYIQFGADDTSPAIPSQDSFVK
jgi:hypothetical protein